MAADDFFPSGKVGVVPTVNLLLGHQCLRPTHLSGGTRVVCADRVWELSLDQARVRRSVWQLYFVGVEHPTTEARVELHIFNTFLQ